MEFLQVANHSPNYVHCPYNLAHTMLKKSAVAHLTRCPDKPAGVNHCSFNFTHVIKNEDKLIHEENCPNRIILDHLVYESEDIARPNVVVPKAQSIVEDESWDEPVAENEANVHKTIHQRQHCMKPVSGLTKTGRIKHRTHMFDQYSHVDLTFNRNCSLNTRQEASTSSTNSFQNKNNNQK